MRAAPPPTAVVAAAAIDYTPRPAPDPLEGSPMNVTDSNDAALANGDAVVVIRPLGVSGRVPVTCLRTTA